jgi:tetratricopeptide (TPR) repeat protein
MYRLLSLSLIPLGLLVSLCLPTTPNSSAVDPLEGVWIRESDEYAGWVIEVKNDGSGGMEARSLWVPSRPQELSGFQIGEKKMRSIRAKGDGEYSAESLARGEESASYSDFEITLTHPARMIAVADLPSGQIGDRQRYRRIAPADVEYAFALYGRALIAGEKERFDEMAKTMELAARQLIKAKPAKALQPLANNIAWMLATADDKPLKNPQLALQLVPYLGDWFQHVDTAAAVYAANGNYQKAVALQKQAIAQISAENAGDVRLREEGIPIDNPLALIGIAFANGVQLSQWKQDFEQRLQVYEEQLKSR